MTNRKTIQQAPQPIAERTLRGGRRLQESPQPVALKIDTRCPEKWVAVDLETGEAWMVSPQGWTRVRATQREEVLQALTLRTQDIAKRRYKSRFSQDAYEEMISHAHRRMGVFFAEGRPSRATPQSAAFWDGYQGIALDRSAVPDSLTSIAHAAGEDYAEANPGIFDFVQPA